MTAFVCDVLQRFPIHVANSLVLILEAGDLPLHLPGIPLVWSAANRQVHAEGEGHVRGDQAVQVLIHLLNPANVHKP